MGYGDRDGEEGEALVMCHGNVSRWSGVWRMDSCKREGMGSTSAGQSVSAAIVIVSLTIFVHCPTATTAASARTAGRTAALFEASSTGV